MLVCKAWHDVARKINDRTVCLVMADTTEDYMSALLPRCQTLALRPSSRKDVRISLIKGTSRTGAGSRPRVRWFVPLGSWPCVEGRWRPLSDLAISHLTLQFGEGVNESQMWSIIERVGSLYELEFIGQTPTECTGLPSRNLYKAREVLSSLVKLTIGSRIVSIDPFPSLLMCFSLTRSSATDTAAILSVISAPIPYAFSH